MVDADGFENAEKCRGSTGLFEAIAGQLGPGLGAQDSKKTWGTDSENRRFASREERNCQLRPGPTEVVDLSCAEDVTPSACCRGGCQDGMNKGFPTLKPLTPRMGLAESTASCECGELGPAVKPRLRVGCAVGVSEAPVQFAIASGTSGDGRGR
eukprot:symbB.v1.2.007562.t1/scaffold461.1/size201717/3